MKPTIRTKLMLSHFGVILLVTLVMGAAGYVLMTARLKETRNESLTFNARVSARQIEGFLARKENLLEHIATGEEVENFPRRYRVLALGKYFTRFQQDFSRLSFFSAAGREEVKVVRGQIFSDQVAASPPPLVEAAAARPGGVFIGAARWSADLETYVVPMALGLKRYFEDEFIGVLLGTISLTQLRSQALIVGMDQEIRLRLLDEQGRILVSPAAEEVMEPVRLSGGDASAPLERILNLEYGLARGQLMGVDSYLAFSPVPRTGWSVLSSISHARYDAAPGRMRRTIAAVFAVTCALGLGLAYLLATGFGRPLSRLTRAAGEVAAGRRTPIEDIERGDEIGDLARAFNRMLTELERTTVSRNDLENILRSMGESLIVVTLDGTIKVVNDATVDLLGYRREELLEKPILTLFAEETCDLDTWFDYLIDSRGGRRIEKFYLTRDGHRIPVAFSSAVLEDAEGNMDGVVCVARDVREQKRAQRELHLYAERLADSNRELEEFAFIASHDLQEPLRKIHTFAQRLAQGQEDRLDESGRDYLQRMQGVAGRMQSLIQSLLVLSRVTTRAQDFTAVDLGRVAREVLEDLALRIEESQAQVTVEPLPQIEGDPLQLRQLLQNLVDNALKFHPPGESPVVEITCEDAVDCPDLPGQTCCRIGVADRGIGLDERYADKIFGVFQRLHGRDRYEGSGIGLAICAKIVHRHRGTIVARSRPGGGSHFIVHLPLTQYVAETTANGQ